LTALAVRSALLHLAAGATLGALILWDKGLPLAPELRRFLPAHRELLLIGWMAQLALAVAYWILPRFSVGEARPRAWMAWSALVCLNLGVQLTAWAGPLGLPAPVVAAGRALELSAAVLFAGHAWPRVKPFGV
jgi:hypothetical protein